MHCTDAEKLILPNNWLPRPIHYQTYYPLNWLLKNPKEPVELGLLSSTGSFGFLSKAVTSIKFEPLQKTFSAYQKCPIFGSIYVVKTFTK